MFRNLIVAVAAIALMGPAAMADIKLKVKTSFGGTAFEGTTYIKGQRERTSQNLGGAMTIDTITQCDLKRRIQINDRSRTYMITPFDDGSPSTAAPTDTRTQRPQSQTGPTRRGGVITYITSVIDTGERKQMFGFTARHLKTTMSVESSPDACNPVQMRMETDGWYIDLEYSFNCSSEKPAPPPMPPSRTKPDCRDEVRFKTSGSARLGYPVLLTTTIYMANGQTTTTSQEVLELSRATLDASLFDVPADYTQAASYQELMGMPSMGSIAAGAATGRGRAPNPPMNENLSPGTKQAGGIRVGVVAVNNKTDRSISTDAARNTLIAGIAGSNVDAVPIDATSPAAIEAEAKQKNCDYILYTTVAALKKSGSKVGGLLGRAAGVDVAGEKFEARLDFTLVATGNTSPVLTSSSTAKEDGGDIASVSAAADREAKAVLSEVRKRR